MASMLFAAAIRVLGPGEAGYAVDSVFCAPVSALVRPRSLPRAECKNASS